MSLRRPHPDLLAILVLVALWLFFFWRLFTPVEGDQASLTRGDFSGQFVTFGAYQYARFAAGEVPLWNPYNNGGLPFIADTQAAVFYPPRLVTIALSKLSGGWSYHALELEMTAHVLAYTLMMYALVRRMTLGRSGSVYGALIAAIVAGYNGFTGGYPPLQLALLEAAIWLPLGVLGVVEATRSRDIRWRWLAVAGFALGLSWLAGHPQTSYFLTLLLVVYYGYRCWNNGDSMDTRSEIEPAGPTRRSAPTNSTMVGRREPISLPPPYRSSFGRWVAGVALIGAVAFGMAAVQLLPGFEYLARTARAGFEYEAKGNGFPVQDVLQFVFPRVVSVFSPLFVGIAGLLLALIATGKRAPQAAFWGVVALLALLWSLGANGVLYPLLYNLLPGLRFFRGQERAAFLVANALAILAGLGAVQLARWNTGQTPRLRAWLNRLFAACFVIAALVVVVWFGSRDAYGALVGQVVFSTIIVGVLALLIPAIVSNERREWLRWLLPVVLVIDLFTVSMDAEAVYDPVPPGEQFPVTFQTLLNPILIDRDGAFRVDGFRGLLDNYGSLYEVMDMRGISPLFLSGPFALIEPEKINPRAWELFAVRYVYSDWQELPVPSEIVTAGTDRYGLVNLHRLSDPRPFAQLMTRTWIAGDVDSALAAARDPAIDARRVVVLETDPGLEPADASPVEATVTAFAPEAVTISVDAPQAAILSVSLPYYPGWRATVDGEPTDILRAYGALTALVVPPGSHTVELVYDPLTYKVGALVSLVTWAALGILLAVTTIRAIRKQEI